MNGKYKYLIVIFFLLFSMSSYSQRLVAEDGSFIIDTYGMNKNILVVTAAEQAIRKDTTDGSTLNPAGTAGYIEGYINRLISAKFKISPEASPVLDNWDAAKQYCVDMEPKKAWRLPTLNEALLMLIFYSQMKSNANQGIGDAVPGFVLPEVDAKYATATWDSDNYYFYFWERGVLNVSKGLYGYYGTSNRTFGDINVRCVSDIPQ